MTDYMKVAEALRGTTVHDPMGDEQPAIYAAIDLCELAAKATAEIDPDEERASCGQYAREFLLLDDAPMRIEMIARAREDARAQAVLAAHVAYRELTDALAEFFHCGDPDDLKRVERAYDKTREL